MREHPIGIFDSGYGGLTVLKEIKSILPQYDYIYLGDNARAPYGTKSFDTIYTYTLQAVKWFFSKGCHLVILACNTASAKALRSIQQNDLPGFAPEKRVLGVIRPTAEVIGEYSLSKNVGVFATEGTVLSDSYKLEIQKFFPELTVVQQACPAWVPLVENNMMLSQEAADIVQGDLKKIIRQNENIDVLLLACTHYPLLLPVIEKYNDNNLNIISQGEIVAKKLKDYLLLHKELEEKCSKKSTTLFFTTGSAQNFQANAAAFYGEEISVSSTSIEHF